MAQHNNVLMLTAINAAMPQNESHHVQDGASPLFAASQEGHTAVVNILIEAGADVHQAMTTV